MIHCKPKRKKKESKKNHCSLPPSMTALTGAAVREEEMRKRDTTNTTSTAPRSRATLMPGPNSTRSHEPRSCFSAVAQPHTLQKRGEGEAGEEGETFEQKRANCKLPRSTITLVLTVSNPNTHNQYTIPVDAPINKPAENDSGRHSVFITSYVKK